MSTPVRAPSLPDRRTTLYDDPEAPTCPEVPVFRHPAYRLLRPICYVGMPVGALGAALRGYEALLLTVYGYGGFLALVVASLALAAQHARLGALHHFARRKAAGQRFLCPSCFRFGPVKFACGKCEEELEEFVVYTGGLYLNDCAECRARVFRRWPRTGHVPRALCVHCGADSPGLHHRRRVRLLGTLGSADLQALRLAAGGPDRLDDGETLTYLADLGAWVKAADELPRDHAGRCPDALWLGEGWDDPLDLAHALDRVITRAGLSDARRRAVTACVAAQSLSPHAQDLLASRFGTVRYGVSAEDFVREA